MIMIISKFYFKQQIIEGELHLGGVNWGASTLWGGGNWGGGGNGGGGNGGGGGEMGVYEYKRQMECKWLNYVEKKIKQWIMHWY